jgi:hypothetical protein
MTTVTGYAFTPRGIPYFVSLDWERSLLFDAMGSTGGGTVWMSGYLIIVFLYISVLNVHRDFRPGRWLRPSNLFHTLPLVLFSCGGVVLLAELILTQNEMGAASRYFLQHINTATMAFLLATAITLIAVVTMSTAVVKELQKR